MIALLKHPRTWFVPYVVAAALAGLLPRTPTDLESFFWPSALAALDGRPLYVYSVHGLDTYPNANGPVGLVPLVLVQEVARALGWLDAYYPRRTLVMGLFSCFVVLMAREAVIAIEELRGGRLSGWPRLLAYAAFALAPLAFQSLVSWGQVEQPIEVWFVLLAVRWTRSGWWVRAGLALGLAGLTRSSSVLFVAALAFAAWRRSHVAVARLVAATVLTGVAGVLPFLVADPADVIHSLVTYRGALTPGAGSIWSVFHGSAPAQAVAQHWDFAFVVAAVLAACLWLATRPGGLTDDRLFAGLTLTAACFALLAKTVWPYYFFEVYVLGTVWAAGRWRRSDGMPALVLLPALVSAFGVLAEVGSLRPQLQSIVAVEGGGMFVLLGATAVWISWTAGRSDRLTAAGRM